MEYFVVVLGNLLDNVSQNKYYFHISNKHDLTVGHISVEPSLL